MLLEIEKHSTSKAITVLTGLVAAVMIFVRMSFAKEDQNGILSSIAVIASVVIAIVPSGLHVVLSQELEARLFARLGEIWGKGKGPRILNIFRFKTEFSEELDTIEERFGPQLNEDEVELLCAARRQRALCRKRPVPIAFIWALMILLALL